jgi:hypothetical protein
VRNLLSNSPLKPIFVSKGAEENGGETVATKTIDYLIQESQELRDQLQDKIMTIKQLES